jgi:hypothetical protein
MNLGNKGSGLKLMALTRSQLKADSANSQNKQAEVNKTQYGRSIQPRHWLASVATKAKITQRNQRIGIAKSGDATRKLTYNSNSSAVAATSDQKSVSVITVRLEIQNTLKTPAAKIET